MRVGTVIGKVVLLSSFDGSYCKADFSRVGIDMRNVVAQETVSDALANALVGMGAADLRVGALARKEMGLS